MKKYRKQFIIITLAIFALVSIFVPTVSYKAIVSQAQCAMMGISAPGTRDVCLEGTQTLFAVFQYPNTIDFGTLAIKGSIINLAIGVGLAGSYVFLRKSHAKS